MLVAVNAILYWLGGGYIIKYGYNDPQLNYISVGFLIVSLYIVYLAFRRSLIGKPANPVLTLLFIGLIVFSGFILFGLIFYWGVW